jgi:serine protease AprX
MSKMSVLLELPGSPEAAAFSMNREASESENESLRQSERLLQNLSGYGIEPIADYPPVPMFEAGVVNHPDTGFRSLAESGEGSDFAAESVVIAAHVDGERLEDLRRNLGVRVWPNSEVTLFERAEDTSLRDTADLTLFAGRVDCAPFRPGAPVSAVQELLGVGQVWSRGVRGQGIAVGILDEGINGNVYPVSGGIPTSGGRAPITSHGSMCAAAVLVSAPDARLFDYPFSGGANSGEVMRMFQAVLSDRRRSGSPHITSNSYGFTERPDRNLNPLHEVWNINHPGHRKVREVVAAGVTTFFAAGNCGAQCPFGDCQSSSIGPGASIHAYNSLREVITVAAVNTQNERLGYSSQGPGGFEPQKPDISTYTHYFGNFGPGRPGGTALFPFDNGTSAAAPLAAGVAALLLSAAPGLAPERVKQSLIASAVSVGTPGWNAETGFGLINARQAFDLIP